MTDITDYAALIGLDWGDQAHAIALQDQALAATEKSTLPHSAESLQDWINALRTRFGGRPVAIALEAKHAPVVHALMQVEFITLYPVNPKTSACYRQAFSPSGAKDDLPDADLLLDLLRLHRDQLTPWHPDDVQTRKLEGLVHARRAAVNLRTQLSNSLTTLLKAYFPQAFELVGEDLFSPMACAFLLKWPDLISLKAARPNSLRAFFQTHNVRRPDTIQKRLERIANAKALTTDQAIVSVSVLSCRLLASQLQKLGQSIKLFDLHIQQVFADHSNAHLFGNLPGAGPVMAPRLLVAFGNQRDRFPLPDNLQMLSGIAPVTEKSGSRKWVHWRWNAPRFLRQTFVEWANQSIHYSSWAAAYYAQQQKGGKRHQAIIRALAFKWIRILWKCWRDNVPYDEARYLKHLASKNSPLVKLNHAK
jgi:transposase